MITNPTVVLPCNCESEFQDKEYGKGMRLHNVSQGGNNKGKQAFCTVCCPRQAKVKEDTPIMPIMGMKVPAKKVPTRKPKTV